MRTLIGLMVLFISTAVHADPISTNPSYACKPDAVRFCKHTLDGNSPFTILACLSAHKKQLTKECKAVLVKYGQ